MMNKYFYLNHLGFLVLFLSYGCLVNSKKTDYSLASSFGEFLGNHPGFLPRTDAEISKENGLPKAAQSSLLEPLCHTPNSAAEGPANIVDYYCPPQTDALAKSKTDGNRDLDYVDPDGKKPMITTIVLHNTEEGFDDTLRIFTTNEIKRVSIHFIVARDGTIVRNIMDSVIAFHAGNSEANKHSIGIEIEASKFNPKSSISAGGMSDTQYAKLINLIKYLKNRYKVPTHNLLPHRAIHTDSYCPSSIWGEPTKDFFYEWRKVAFPN